LAAGELQVVYLQPKARYENGVLWLTLPKKLEAATHRVLIN